MPGNVSQQSTGASGNQPYIPSYILEDRGELLYCKCGHHNGYHFDDTQACVAKNCDCKNFVDVNKGFNSFKHCEN